MTRQKNTPLRLYEEETKIIDGIRDWHENNQTQFTIDRSKTVGASEVFKCKRQVGITKHLLKLYYKLGLAMPMDKNAGYMLRGKIMESAFIAPAIRHTYRDDKSIRNLGDDQETVRSKEYKKLSATPDGLADTYQFEFKSFDPRKAIRTKPDMNHVMQTQVQMGVFGKKTTYLCYFNASDYYDVVVWKIEFDENTYRAAISRAKEIMNNTESWDKLPKEGQVKGHCNFCKHKDSCMSGVLKHKIDYDIEPVKKKQKVKKRSKKVKKSVIKPDVESAKTKLSAG